jgi:drug/metabolite transporter (DMT)-like permease
LNVAFLIIGTVGTVAIAIAAPAESLAATYPFLLGRWAAMGVREWGIILLLAALIVAISAGVAKAYQSGPPAVIATFDYTYLVFAALWSFVFFSELPDTMTAIGMLLIAGAGILAVSPPRKARAMNQVT